jgi:hypothetical protein
MHTSPRLLRIALLFVASFSFALRSARSGEAASAGASMTISRGLIAGVSANGQPVRATVGNLAAEIMRRYPSVTINVVGVEDVVVDDVTVRWPRALDDAFHAVHAVLETLARANEPQKFTVADLAGNQFILGRPRNPEGPSGRTIEVFNLKLYLEGGADPADLKAAVQQCQLRLDSLQKRFPEMKSRVDTGNLPSIQLSELKNAISEEDARLGMLMQKLKRATPTKEEISKRIDDLQRVVASTLEKFNPDEKMPEFEYHAGTHLLIVIGSATAIDVTRKVVSAVEKSSN